MEDVSIYEPYFVGQRVYFYNPNLSNKKFHGTIVATEQRPFGYQYHIKFDGLGVHVYTNGHGFVCIHPEDESIKPTWEV